MKKFLITLLVGVLLTTGAASAFGVRVGESEADVTAYRTERETDEGKVDEGKADLPEETVSSELETVWEPQSVHLLSAGGRSDPLFDLRAGGCPKSGRRVRFYLSV